MDLNEQRVVPREQAQENQNLESFAKVNKICFQQNDTPSLLQKLVQTLAKSCFALFTTHSRNFESRPIFFMMHYYFNRTDIIKLYYSRPTPNTKLVFNSFTQFVFLHQ